MMMIIRVTTTIGANTAAIIQRLFGGFLTTAEIKKNKCVAMVWQDLQMKDAISVFGTWCQLSARHADSL